MPSEIFFLILIWEKWETLMSSLMYASVIRDETCNLGICSDQESNGWHLIVWEDTPTNWATLAREKRSSEVLFGNALTLHVNLQWIEILAIFYQLINGHYVSQ